MNATRRTVQRGDCRTDMKTEIRVATKKETTENIPHPHTINWSFLTQGNLYGRKKEMYRLLEAFQRQTSIASQPELVILSGDSGVGKTELAKTLSRYVSDRQGFFISGKLTFDHLEYPEPYAPFVAALTEFFNYAIGKGAEFVESIRNDIAQVVDPSERRLLRDMIPAMKKFVDCSFGDENTSCMNGGADAHQRFRILFCKFIRSICSPKHPLVLLVDDLQWADSATLALLQELSAAQNMDGLMLLCTCRGNEVGFHGEAAVMLRALDKKKVKVTEIELLNLSEKTVTKMIADLLNLDHATSKPLAEIIFIQSKGNIFFVMELLRSLHQDRTIHMDSTESRWKWCESKISILAFVDNVQSLLATKLSKSPQEVQELLKTAACIGSDFEEHILTVLLPTLNVAEALIGAKRIGFIMEDRQISGGFRFVHDRFHQAAYELIPEREQNEFHLSIGRRMMEGLTKSNEKDDNIFLLVNQLSRGMEVIQCQNEKDEIAGLCLQAGKMSMKASDFTLAARYFQRGIDFLRTKDPQTLREASRHWKENYYLCLELHNMAAESEFVNGNFDETDKLVANLLKNARSLRDKMRAYNTQVYSLGARHRLQEAINTGLAVLSDLGETFTREEPSKTQILMQSSKTKAMLWNKTDEYLVGLPLMLDDDKLDAMSIMNVILNFAHLKRSSYAPILSCRMVQLTLRYGVSAISSYAFAFYAMMRCSVKDISGGHRYGQVALKMLDRFNMQEWAPRVHTMIDGFVKQWTVSLREVLKGLQDSMQMGLRTGDIDFAMIAANLYVAKMEQLSEPLGNLEREIVRLRRLMQQYKQQTWFSLVSVSLQYVQNLRGKSGNPIVLTGEALDQESAINQAQTTRNNVHFLNAIYYYRIVLACIFNDYYLALELESKVMFVSKAAFRNALVFLYAGISAVALYRQTQTNMYLKMAKKCLKGLQGFSRCAKANYLNKELLLKAEIGAVRGKIDDDVLAKYSKSIDLAKAEGFLLEQAVALECASQTLQHAGRNALGQKYLLEAYECYEKWGAKAKTEQMLRRYPSLQSKVVSTHRVPERQCDEMNGVKF